MKASVMKDVKKLNNDFIDGVCNLSEYRKKATDIVQSLEDVEDRRKVSNEILFVSVDIYEVKS